MFRQLILPGLLTLLVTACSTSLVPYQHPELVGPALPATESPLTWWQRLDEPSEDKINGAPPASGFRLIDDGAEAFEARIISARLAHQHLNIKYYIWRNDKSGQRLIYELINAAERGVKVSVLLDDMDVRGSDEALALLDQHENIEVRVFNPFISRSGLLRFGIEFIFRGSALNHRMHNKAWIADGHFAIVGGRNVGDEYFDGHTDFNFTDLDMAIFGPLAHQADQDFADYWNSPASVPIHAIKRLDEDRATLKREHKNLRSWLASQQEHPLFQAIPEDEELALSWLSADSYEWTSNAELVTDDPAKATGVTDPEPGVLEALARYSSTAQERIWLVSSYFVPGEEGTRYLTDLASQGLDVRVLTNSLAATDVVFAHSGYARRRHPLLLGGVTLYELKPRAIGEPDGDSRHQGLGLGSSRASLHTKAILFDDHTLFVGSFNLDPRSANINTEMGVITQDPVLARQFAELFEESTQPAFTYHVTIDEKQRIIWTDGLGDVYFRDPNVSLWRRFLSGLAGLLPIESQL